MMFQKFRPTLWLFCAGLAVACGGPALEEQLEAAHAQLERRRFAEAEQQFTLILQRARDNAEAHGGLGVALMEQDKCRQALDPLRTATRLDAGDVAAWANLGYCNARLGEDAAAIDAYQRAAKLEPGELELWQSIESLYEHTRDYGNLLQIRTRLADMQDKSPSSMLALAEAYCLYGEFAHCELLARDVIGRTSRSADAQATLGLALHGQGKLQDAARALRAALQLDNTHAAAWQRLVAVLTHSGAQREAQAAQRMAESLGMPP